MRMRFVRSRSEQVLRKGLLLSALVAFTVSAPSTASAQQTKPQTPQTPEVRVWGDPDGFTGSDCETTMMVLDFVEIANRESGKQDQSIIIVARRGRRERSQALSASRLKQAADYLTRRMPREQIVTAEGDATKGLGQLEFYVAGRLHTVIKVRRNRDLVRGCGVDH